MEAAKRTELEEPAMNLADRAEPLHGVDDTGGEGLMPDDDIAADLVISLSHRRCLVNITDSHRFCM